MIDSAKNVGSSPSCDLRRQHLDNEGMIVDDHGRNKVNATIVKYLSTLVDTEKVHIRFQVCSH